MDQPTVTPYTATSRRLNTTGTSSTALASLQSHRVPMNRWLNKTTIFAAGDSLEEEVEREVKSDRDLTKARERSVLKQLADIRKRIDEGERARFDQWTRELRIALETSDHPGWNYFCDGNKKIIDESIKNVWGTPSSHRQRLVSFIFPPFAVHDTNVSMV